ncbi:MAG TPA: ATP-binding protein, partial [Clostridia bacterium]|nr:ATP-binding protein [Clostridia bacterium]
DLLAGVLATRLHESASLSALMDLGTNGEIVVGNRDRLLCASTAAGPAFEGARISMGMRAATGAVSEVHVWDGGLRCHVLGGGPARGVCGSGLVDAVAAGLELGWVKPSGRLVEREDLTLVPPVKLSQWDIRELQLAKGAISAGLKLLVEQWGARMEDLDRVYLAGAFGNYINHSSARRIGLLDFPADKVQPAGNTALLGAKMALFNPDEEQLAYSELVPSVHHVSLHEHPRFQDSYVEEMGFA